MAALVPRFGYGGPHRRAAGNAPTAADQGSAADDATLRTPPGPEPGPPYQPFSKWRATSAMRTSSRR
ncbi:hypothetical protein GCM10009601_17990 [Streptomyces thermospinosisporus]|uniref:Uncharacterized protein n=1 Tax=Streptomyces thermospinosisporus TaxID=161482 RepID=A0ABP4JEL7_9ACTN